MGRHKIPDEQNVCKFKALGCTHPHFSQGAGERMKKSRHHAVCKFNPMNVAAAAIAAMAIPIASAVSVVPSIAVVPTPAVNMIASGAVSSGPAIGVTEITIMDQVPDAIPTTYVVVEDSPFEMVMRGGESNGKKIRKTNESPPRVSVIDMIHVVCNTRTPENAWRVLERVKVTFGEVSQLLQDFKFPGQGQRDTPVVNARGFVTLINLLPGRRVALFRLESADIVARYLGGDATLIAEINRNAEIQAALPADHPMAIFGQDVAAVNARAVFVTSTDKAIVPCTFLEEEIDIADISVPSLVIAPNCIYAIRVGYYRASNKTILKFD